MERTGGAEGEMIDGRAALRVSPEDEFTVAVERLTHRRVVAFTGANLTAPGVARELFSLDLAPRPRAIRSGA